MIGWSHQPPAGSQPSATAPLKSPRDGGPSLPSIYPCAENPNSPRTLGERKLLQCQVSYPPGRQSGTQQVPSWVPTPRAMPLPTSTKARTRVFRVAVLPPHFPQPEATHCPSTAEWLSCDIIMPGKHDAATKKYEPPLYSTPCISRTAR